MERFSAALLEDIKNLRKEMKISGREMKGRQILKE